MLAGCGGGGWARAAGEPRPRVPVPPAGPAAARHGAAGRRRQLLLGGLPQTQVQGECCSVRVIKLIVAKL